jgi:hypothetical protein
MTELTSGILPKLFGQLHQTSHGPVILQATAVKKIAIQGTERIRVKFSDGVHENQMGMYTGAHVAELENFCVIKLSVWTITGGQENADKSILQIDKFDLVKTAKEVGSESYKIALVNFIL